MIRESTCPLTVEDEEICLSAKAIVEMRLLSLAPNGWHWKHILEPFIWKPTN